MVNDGNIMQNLLPQATEHPSYEITKVTYSCTYLTVGGILGLITYLLLSQTPLGKIVDTDYKKGNISSISKQAQAYAATSGVISAFATLIVLWGNSEYDPSAVTVLTTATVIFVLPIESLFRGLDYKQIMWPVILAGIGAVVVMLPGAELKTLQAGGIILAIITLLLIKNLLSGFEEVISGDGATLSDATSFSFWRFFWLAFAGAIISVGVVVITGQYEEYKFAVKSMVTNIPYWVVLTMIFVFMGMGWKQVAKKPKFKLSITEVVMISSFSGFVSAVYTAVVNWVWPETFPEAPLSLGHWIVRFIGIGILVLGMYWATKIKQQRKENEQESERENKNV